MSSSSYVQQKSSLIWVSIVILGLQSEKTQCSVSGMLRSQVSAEMHFVAREMYLFLSSAFFVVLSNFL